MYMKDVIILKENNKKQEILLSAFQILSEEGLNNITLRKVANKANIATGLILHYFKNKEHLINEVINYLIKRCEEFYSPEIDFSSNDLKKEFLNFIDSLFLLSINDKVSAQAYYSVYTTALKDEHLKCLFINSMYKSRKNLGFYLDFFKRKGIIDFKNEDDIINHLLIVLEGLSYYKNIFINDYFYNKSLDYHKSMFLKLVNFTE